MRHLSLANTLNMCARNVNDNLTAGISNVCGASRLLAFVALLAAAYRMALAAWRRVSAGGGGAVKSMKSVAGGAESGGRKKTVASATAWKRRRRRRRLVARQAKAGAKAAKARIRNSS
jgi:hypothetical protein